MKLFKAFMLGIAMIFVVSLYGCSKENDYSNKSKVVFELEGGVYQNCTLPVFHFYDVEENGSTLIYELNHFSKQEFERAGYVFQGWYKTKNIEGDKVTYSDEWNFESDQISKSGVTLYAYWKKAINHTFDVCYTDENNKTVTIGSYEVEEGDTFDDYMNYAKKRVGFTALNFKDEQGNLWDDSFKHPGGEQDLNIKVFVEYIKGEYAIVRTAKELKANKNKNIYLMNNIDMNEEELSFGDYKKDFQGNGFTISNFTIAYDGGGTISDFDEPQNNSLYISLFKSLDGANIENVTFDKVSVVVNTNYSKIYKIYVSGLASKITNSTIKNVTFNGTYSYIKLPANFDVSERLVYVTDKLAYLIDDKSKLDNTTINIEIL